MLSSLGRVQFQTATQLRVYAEGTWLYGAFVAAILYGIDVVLYVMCACSLWGRIHSRDATRKKQWFLFIYVNLLFALNTIFVAANLQITQLGFINNEDYPGGPSAYESHTSSVPLNLTFVGSNWCADALMIWRCHVVYRDSKYHPIVTGIGCLMLLASVVTGSIWAVVMAQPAHYATGWMSHSLLFPYLSISLAINIIICTLTVLRLLHHQAYISKAFGPAYGVLYTSFAAMVVESAAVYSICSLLYLVSYAADSPLANAFVQVLGAAQGIAPLLIIYRVSEGKAWTRDTARRLKATGSYALRGLATESTPITYHSPGELVQVPCQGVQHIECGSLIQPADEEGKGLAM